MVPQCCYCGISLERAAQYIGIADVILGLAHFIVLVIHVKEVYDYGGDFNLSFNTGTSSDDYSYRIHTYGYGRTFPRLNFLPPGLAIAMTVCFGIQAVMGIFLYLSASNKNRKACLFWLTITAITCLFSNHFFFRIYQMLIVNEFAHALKQEQEVSYFSGQQPQSQPIQVQLQHYHHHPPQQQPTTQQPGGIVPPIEPQVSLVAAVSHSPYNFPQQQGCTVSEVHSIGNPYYSGHPHPPVGVAMQQVPAALQPPPQYDVAVNNPGSSGTQDFGGIGSYNNGTSNRSTNIYPSSDMFPNPNSKSDGYGFSKF